MFYFKANLPGWERTIRVVTGLVLIGITYLYSTATWMDGVGFVVGIILAGTGFLGFCPMCAMAGRKAVEGKT
ncbi:MAG: DUF2892 domain-containing protein [Alphaproteobacteria bacterium]|nr:DUF2892 domain-containing protein [Alphaproteobacteria bacterium]